VYSLGIVLYEMLSGSVPFRRPRTEDPYKAAIEVIRQHLKENPEPIRKRNPDVQISPRLERVTMRALKKDLGDRFRTAKEMRKALGYRESPIRPMAAPPQPTSAQLLIVQGPRKGHRIDLGDKPMTLGRLELGSTNTTISRRHASIVYRGGSYWLEDMSKNGTWVDNSRVYGEVPLKTGSLIVIGDNVLKLA
jgi:serine/threonine protein kinase